MYNLTLQDKSEMKYMGYVYRALFKTQRGVPFDKNFKNKAEMDLFVKQAAEHGIKLVQCLKR